MEGEVRAARLCRALLCTHWGRARQGAHSRAPTPFRARRRSQGLHSHRPVTPLRANVTSRGHRWQGTSLVSQVGARSSHSSEEDSVQWSSGCCCRPGPRPSQGWQASRACAAVGSGGVGKVGLAHKQPQATLRTQHPNPVMLLGPCCWASTATPLTHPHTAAPDPCTAAGRCAPWHLARDRRGAGSTWGAC